MSNDTQESLGGSTRPRLIHPSVLTQMQIERLKREDEEEHWISGEELYTEGSSDDDDDNRLTAGIGDPELIRHAESIRSNYRGHPVAGGSKLGGSGRSLLRYNQKVKIDSAIKSRDEERKNDSSSSSSIDLKKLPQGAGDREDPEEDREISWRPKRDDYNYETILRLDNCSAIVELRELQFEYGDIVDSLSDIKTALTPLDTSLYSGTNSRKWYTGNNCENETSDDVTAAAVNGGDIIIEDDGVSFNECLDRWSETVVNNDKIEKEISKVVKLDHFIEEMYDEVKKASEETLREQILNREELRKMESIRAPESGRMAKNSTLFFKLCDSTKSHSEPMISEPTADHEMDFEEELESRQSRRENLEDKLTQLEKRKENFIERNKELASCAIGTLAITDEEKKRLEKLLEDVDDEECGSGSGETDRETGTSFSTVVSTPYKIDEEADELLKELTEQLSNINSETYRKSGNEERNPGEFLPHEETTVLNSLRNLAESGSKEIYPISEEEVRQLISEYHAEQEAKDLKSCSNLSSTTSETPTIAQKVIRELIREAKTTMPFFQFKYQTEDIEKEN